MAMLPKPSNLLSIYFGIPDITYPSDAARRTAARRLRIVEDLMPREAQLRAILTSAIICIAAEPPRPVIAYRVVSEADQDHFPGTHAHVLAWNMIAFSAGFKQVFHRYGMVASRCS